MANTFKKNVVNEKSTQRKSTGSQKQNVVLKSLRKFISGDYLFSNNMWRSPLWFVLYVVVLIMFIVTLRFAPVRKYNEIMSLRKELKEITVKNHSTKARISVLTTPDVLLKEFVKDKNVAYSDIIAEPTVIKVIDSNGKGK